MNACSVFALKKRLKQGEKKTLHACVDDSVWFVSLT